MTPPPPPRHRAGQIAHHGGKAAEDIVERHYVAQGLRPLARRWRGGGGELDLVFDDGTQIVFVEVKQGADFARAAARLGAAQIGRWQAAAAAWLAATGRPMETALRFDLALVDAQGRVELIPGALTG